MTTWIALVLLLFAGEVERAEQWPELTTSERREIEKNVQRLRKARTETMEEEAVAFLTERGPACAPELLDALGGEKKPELRARIAELLVGMTNAEHTRLLARELDHRSAEVRVFCLERAARFPDEGLRAAAEKHLAQTLAAREREKRGVPEEEAWAAALFAASTGSTEGLPTLFGYARDDWDARSERLRIALAAAKGPDASRVVVAQVDEGDVRSVTAALRMLWDAGDEDVGRVYAAKQLYHDDPVVRLAAVNAMRRIVDGAEPLEDVSVFDGIQRADAWKRRL